MDLGNLLQSLSLVAVAISLVLSARQIRLAGKQTREAAEQSELARSAMLQRGHHSLVSQGTGSLEGLLFGQPELLAWFLASRGIPPGTDELNQRYLLIYLRMDQHEVNYLDYLNDGLPEEVWRGWQRVISHDVRTAEFQTVWSVVKDQYSERFVTMVDGTIPRQSSSPVSR
jgi:hypothetical protein